MRLLLDTHVFLWSLLDTAKLSATARVALADPANEIAVSAVSFWEVAIKSALGKLSLQGVAADDLPAEARKAGYIVTPLDAEVAASSHKLPASIHRDPFDRMLAWQAICESCTLVSRDRAMAGFETRGLKLLW